MTLTRKKQKQRRGRKHDEQQQQQQQRHVTFHDDKNEEFPAVPLEPLTDEERANRWYTPKELNEFKNNNTTPHNEEKEENSGPVSDNMGLLESSPSSSSVQHTPTLLEEAKDDNTPFDYTFSKKSTSNKRGKVRQQEYSKNSSHKKRQEFIETLLAQQWEHKQMGISDPKGLYQLSKACSKQARLHALQQAKEDAKLVQQLQEDNHQHPQESKNRGVVVQTLAQQLDFVLDIVGNSQDQCF